MRLSIDIIALVHQVELTRARWWRTALERLVEGLLCQHGPMLPSELLEIARNEFPVALSETRLHEILAVLERQSRVVSLPDRRVNLSETRRGEVKREIDQARALEQAAKEELAHHLRRVAPEVDTELVWSLLHETVLDELLSKRGATIYELVQSRTSGPALTSAEDPGVSLEPVISRFAPNVRERVSEILLHLLSGGTETWRSYMLMNLDSYFCVGTLGVREDELEVLLAGRKPGLDIFLDTNVVFSILDLHDNPYNSAVRLVLDLVRRAAGHLNARLFVTTTTVSECIRTLRAARQNLKKMRSPTVELAQAAIQSGHLRGLEARYFAKVAEVGPIDPDHYFSPFIDNLSLVLKDEGVDVHGDPAIRRYAERDDVQKTVEDLVWRGRHEWGGKTHDQALHDAILWTYVAERRPNSATALMELRSWVLTLDHSLANFDRDSGRCVCLLPDQLLDLLRFFIPRDQHMAQAVVESSVVRLLRRQFDRHSEEVTLRILSLLSRYERVEDLKVGTIREILMNDNLRARLANVDDDEDEMGVMQDTVLGLLEEYRNRVASQEERLNQLESRVNSAELSLANKSREVQVLQQEVSDLKRSRDEAEREQENLKQEYHQLQREFQEREYRTFITQWVVMSPIIIALLISLIRDDFGTWPSIIAGIALMTFWGVGLYLKGRSITTVRVSRWFQGYMKVLSMLGLTVGTVALHLLIEVAKTFLWRLIGWS